MKNYILILFVFIGSQIYSQEKDTLFFKFDEKYFTMKKGDYNEYFIIKDSTENLFEGFFFVKGKIVSNNNGAKKMYFKEYIRTNFYDPKSKKLKSSVLYHYLQKRIIIFEKNNILFEAFPSSEIID